jgi:7-cyano-7-deazaguanine synthase
MKILVLSSGGVDSTTCLALAVEEVGAENVLALSIYYGQKHDKEILAAQAVAAHYGVKRLELDLSTIFAGSDCSLLKQSSQEIPLESYGAQIEKTGGKSPVSTYVPFRNGLFLSAAASIALSHGCEKILYGAHADDAAGAAYPDCSLQFVEAMDRAIQEGTGGQLRLEAPFVSVTKAEVVRQGLRLGVPYEKTWSCYQGGQKPCGVCGTCIDRQNAFLQNGVTDPLLD